MYYGFIDVKRADTFHSFTFAIPTLRITDNGLNSTTGCKAQSALQFRFEQLSHLKSEQLRVKRVQKEATFI